MRRLLRSEAGITLPEVLLAAVLMLLVLGATLTSLSEFATTSRATEEVNDSQQRARQSIDQLVRELRNHAVANTNAPEGIAVAEPYDLVFETVGHERPTDTSNSANIERIRYCLGEAPFAEGELWAQVQTWTSATAPPLPSTADCPDPDWPARRLVAEDVVNRSGGARPLFTYDSTVPAEVRRVQVSLYIDMTPGRGAGETHLQSGVFLRNANHPPVASFTARVLGSGVVVLNATGSSDPEGQRLAYAWRVNGAALSATSATVDYTPSSPGTLSVTLTVTDPGGLYASTTEAVTVQ
ncbi:MAG: PKD domain-containing protein [Actinomycetota bacterium]|nr:PKD domain-containing protein [Actinomycetota bacterium]